MTTKSSTWLVAAHAQNADGWLNDHFEVCRNEYEALAAAAGFRPGDSILDVACGSGSFLPVLQRCIGPQGSVVAFDMDPEKLKSVASDGHSVWQGSLEAMPLANASLDGVWCSNALQFFDDDALVPALRELARVVKAGGTVAVKDTDMTAFHFSPAGPFLMSHLSEAGWRLEGAPPEARGSLRGRELRRWLERAGLVDVRQRSVFIERWAPLSQSETSLWAAWLSYLAKLAEERGVPEADLRSWREIATDGGLPFVSQPEFYGCEVQVLACGRVA